MEHSQEGTETGEANGLFGGDGDVKGANDPLAGPPPEQEEEEHNIFHVILQTDVIPQDVDQWVKMTVTPARSLIARVGTIFGMQRRLSNVSAHLDYAFNHPVTGQNFDSLLACMQRYASV